MAEAPPKPGVITSGTMTAAEAQRLAEAEGLSLVLALGNASGYNSLVPNLNPTLTLTLTP